MLELLSLIGSAGAGKIFGSIGDAWSRGQQRKEQNEEREFQRSLADKGMLKEYLESTSEDDDGNTTFMGYVLGSLFIMFGFTACAFVLWCAWAQFAYPGAGDLALQNPDPPKKTISLLAGAIKYDWASHTITRISPLGFAYLTLHPLLFILSMVSSLQKGQRRK